MCAMPEKHREPVHDAFIYHFNELQNDMLNIQQIIVNRKKSDASFDTISNEIEALKEDGINQLVEMHHLLQNNKHLFPERTHNFLMKCQNLLNNIHPELLTQEKWAFKEKLLNEFKNNLGY